MIDAARRTENHYLQSNGNVVKEAVLKFLKREGYLTEEQFEKLLSELIVVVVDPKDKLFGKGFLSRLFRKKEDQPEYRCAIVKGEE